MGNIKGNSGDSIEWHQKKTREYFADCFKVYDHFLKMSDELIFALLKYVNDGTHTGPEADASKAFINEKQIPLIENSIYCIQKLQSMMTGKGFESNVPLLEDFIADMSENEEAVIKLDHVGKVITDFAGYNTTFKAVHPKVTDIHDEVEKLVKDCDEIKRKSFTNPNPGATNTALDAFVSTDKSAGFVPGFKNKFTNFHNEHSNDIEGSAFKELLDVIVANMKAILDGLQKGTFDITKYVGRNDSLKWIDPTKLDSDQLDEYLKYLQSYRLYLQGYIDRCQVYKYDPVNLSSGNYINDRVDIEIGGLDFRRFYNAKSDFRGFLGRGWSCKADARLREEGEDIRITYSDGKEGLYKKIEQTENSYYEIHGEIGILKKENSYYRIEKDLGEYEEYDSDGYLVAEGDHTGEKTRITYDNSYPVKIEENNGSYLVLTYNEDGAIVGVTDSEGRKVTFGYETREGNDRKDYFLTDVTYPNGSTRRYIYDEAGLIQSVISPDGIVALKNEYDEYGRVIHQTFPDGGEMSYSYDDEKRITTATEQNGLKVEYLSDELGRHIGTRYAGLNDNFTKQGDFDKKDFIEERFTYNERGQKTSITNKNGHTTRYSYDKKGHLTKIVGPEGLNESYTYDAQGRLLSKKDSEGNKYKYTYDFDGNLYSITDPLGNRTKYNYEDGKVVRIKDADGNEISITYDENGNISSLTDKNGVKTLYLCDKQGRVNKTIDAEGNETGYCFDENGNITEVIDPIGNRTSYKYTKSDLLTEVINPDGTSKVWGYNEIGKVAFFKDEEDRITEFSYNNMWNKEKMILPNGGEVLYSYDLLGNLIKTTDPEGRKTVYSYDNEGNILSLGIESGEKKILTKTIYTYDKRGRVISEVDAEGNKTIYSYDKNGNLICKTDALGGKTSYEYDSLQRVVKQTDAIGRTTLYTYNKNGKEDTVTDPAGVVTKNYYSKDRLIKVTRKESAEHAKELTVKTYEYDSCGRIKKEKLADGFTASYEYDKAGRISVITGSNGRVMKHYYDSMGRIIEQDDCGTKTFYTYTGTGKLKSITDALGNEIRYSYNELDLLCKIERTGKDSESLEGRVTTFEHDLAGNLTGETDALSQKTLYSYDDMGELCTKIDRDGNETIYTRDGNGNITGIRYMDGSEVIYKYDALNTLMEVKEKIGLTKIDSDVLGRTVKVTNPRGEVVEYEYGARDEKTAIVYPDGKRVDYLYDAFGNLTELKEKSKDGKEQSIKYKYDEIGNLRQKLFPNNTSTEYEYYQGGFIKSLVSNDRDGVLDKYEYIYNEKGNATQVKRDRRGLAGVSGIFSYSYDELGRLTESKKDGVLVDSYSYDAYGNRVEQNSNGIKTTYSYDILDRLVNKVEYSRDAKTNTTRYSYDKRGNLIEEYENEILSKTYDFNMQGFIEHAVIDPESELSRKINYEYNYAGMRVSKESDREKVRYVTDVTMDHNNLIMEIRDGEVITYTYDEDVVSIENGKNRSFYQTDELGSTMYLTGTDGAAYCSYAYDVFGNRLDPQTGKRYRNNPDGHKYIKHGNIIQPFAFTGYREEEDGKYYAQARDYDPTSGRFTGEDRVRGIMTIPDSVNHYLYCINDPITYVDNNGLLFGWLKKAAKSVVSAVKTAGKAVVNTVKTVGTAAVNTVKKVGKAIAEDPCKFLAEVGTGIVVGLATTAAAVAVVATLPVSGPALVAAGAVAMGAAGAATGTVANIAGQLASKEFEKTGKINWKEVGSSAIGGAIGGAVFGGAAGAAGSAMSSRAMQLTVAGISGEAGGMAAEGTRQAMNGEKFNFGKFMESGLMGGLTGMACAAVPVGGGPKSAPSKPNSSCTAENGTTPVRLSSVSREDGITPEVTTYHDEVTFDDYQIYDEVKTKAAEPKSYPEDVVDDYLTESSVSTEDSLYIDGAENSADNSESFYEGVGIEHVENETSTAMIGKIDYNIKQKNIFGDDDLSSIHSEQSGESRNNSGSPASYNAVSSGEYSGGEPTHVGGNTASESNEIFEFPYSDFDDSSVTSNTSGESGNNSGSQADNYAFVDVEDVDVVTNSGYDSIDIWDTGSYNLSQDSLQGVHNFDLASNVPKNSPNWDLIRLSLQRRNQGNAIRLTEQITSIDQLPEFHRAALREYTSENYKRYNKYKWGVLRRDQMAPEELEVIRLLDEVFEHAYYTRNGALVRGTNLDELAAGGLHEFIPSCGIDRKGNLLYDVRDVKTKDLVDKTYTQDGYFSTSSVRAFDGQVVVKVVNPKGAKALDIADVSYLRNESEVLFRSGQKFKILEAKVVVDKSKPKLHITVELE